MKVFFILSMLFLMGETAYEQTPSTSPAFNYQRDFKTILEKTKDKGGDLYYQKLLIRFLNNDSSLTRAETLALMIGFTENAHYKPYDDLGTEKEIFDLNDGGDYEAALDESKTYLQTHPLSLRILKERSYAYHQIRKADSAQYFMDLVDKVMGAMIYSGKGKTQDAPIFSLGLIDGEHFIENAGMTVANKTTTSPKSKILMYIVDALSDEGTHTNYFFILQHARDKMNEDEIGEEPVTKPKKGKKTKKDNKPPKAVKDSIPAKE
ncbi:MAG: DUF4919 domain-containing protein [Ferruginibacter sp.]